MNILLFGPPGAGKGTQSAMLVEKKGMAHISTGDLFRSAIKNETSLGLEAKKYMDKGDLVPDSVTVGMVEEELVRQNGKDIILDGFPRTVPQAEALNVLLDKYEMKIDNAFFLEVPNELLMKRLTGRRMTADGKHVYHLEFNPPKTPGVCDITGEPLIQRKDDQEDVIANRLKAYEESTRPLKDFYKEQGNLRVIDGTGEPKDVFERIVDYL
ncbi:MAG: adenylate kinase [Bdellovibrionales bacterium]|nr:adenylate kinase [Bdellovibrionales bacterium]